MSRKTLFRLAAVAVVLAVLFGVSSMRTAIDEARNLRGLRIEDARDECKDRVRVTRALLERGNAKATTGDDPCAAAEMLATARQQAELAAAACRPVTNGDTMLTGPAARENLAELHRRYSINCEAAGDTD